MDQQVSHRNHFVPKFLLEPWLFDDRGQQQLHGYWWNERRGALDCKINGLNSFCFDIDLLTLTAHKLGQDVIERVFFGEIDTKGAEALASMLEGEVRTLTLEQRTDFARLLLSLDVRRPNVVKKLRTLGPAYVRKELDDHAGVRAILDKRGVDEKATAYVESTLGLNLQDLSLLAIQKVVDNPEVGGRLINAHWGIKRIDPTDGTLVLSDRPLFRALAYNKPGAIWVLPATPTVAFIAANDRANLKNLMDATGQRFAKLMNVSSANQGDRFVFSVSEGHERWLAKHLKRRSEMLLGQSRGQHEQH